MNSDESRFNLMQFLLNPEAYYSSLKSKPKYQAVYSTYNFSEREINDFKVFMAEELKIENDEKRILAILDKLIRTIYQMKPAKVFKHDYIHSQSNSSTSLPFRVSRPVTTNKASKSDIRVRKKLTTLIRNDPNL